MTDRKIGAKSLLASSASAVVIALMTANTGAAFAQGNEQAAADDDVIYVTATKREESIQEVPLAITAITGDFAQAVNLNDVKDIILWTPGITGNSQDSFIDAVSVRGILTNDFGVGGDPSVGFFKNNLYQGRNGNAVSSMFDIERAEALRGPQGFLFGRNAVGGAISIHTTRPNLGTGGGYFDIDVGERGHRVFEGAVNLSENENFGFRLAGYSSREDGWVHNVARPNDDPLLEHEKWGVRASTLYESDGFTAFAFAEYEDRQQDGTAYRAIEDSFYALQLRNLFGLTVGGSQSEGDIDSDLGYDDIDDNSTILNLGMELEWEFDGFTFTSITGFQDHEYFYVEDYDGTNLQLADYLQDQAGDYFQQEFRLTSTGDGPLSWYAGASFYQENIDVNFEEKGDDALMCAYYSQSYYPSYTGQQLVDFCNYYYSYALGELVEGNRAIGDYSGWAAYAQMNYQVTDAFDIGFGLRYSSDNKDFSVEAFDVASPLGPYYTLGWTGGPLTDSRSWDAWQPQAVARYRFDNGVMMFGSITRGYKSGGFGSFAIQELEGQPEIGFGVLGLTNATARPDDFDPETSWSYEAGLKGTGADGDLRWDANVFTYEYEDLQMVVAGLGGGVRVDNVGNVTATGFEFAFEYDMSDNFSFRMNGGHTSSEVTNAQEICPGPDANACEGDGFAHVPEFSGAAMLNYFRQVNGGEVTAAIEAYGQTDMSANGLSVDPTERVAGYIDFTLRAGYHSDNNWSIGAYVENATDEDYWDGIFAGGGILPAVRWGPSRPRTFGVTFHRTFGGG
jgi:iron complex outermembrane receptor protein